MYAEQEAIIAETQAFLETWNKGDVRAAASYYMEDLEQYWGFESDTFQDLPLQADSLDLFVGRESELKKIMMTIRKTVIGVTGTNGVGKTSFLRKIQWGAEEQGMRTIYFSPLVPETSLFREFAKTLLLYALAGKIRLADFSGSEIKKHLRMFDCRVSIEESTEGEIDWKILVGKLSETTSKQFEQHTEDSAISLLVRIFKSNREFCVIFVDDMETMKHTLADSDVYIRQMMYLARFLQSQFLQDSTCYICSLDKEFYKAVHDESLRPLILGHLLTFA